MRTPFPHCRNYIPILTTELKKVKEFFGILFFIKHSALSVFLSRIIFICKNDDIPLQNTIIIFFLFFL